MLRSESPADAGGDSTTDERCHAHQVAEASKTVDGEKMRSTEPAQGCGLLRTKNEPQHGKGFRLNHRKFKEKKKIRKKRGVRVG